MIVTDVRLLQAVNASVYINVTVSGITICVRPVQPPKPDNFLRVEGIEIEVKLVQFANVSLGREVTFGGILNDFSPVQFLKALSSILSTLDGILIDVKEVHPKKADC